MIEEKSKSFPRSPYDYVIGFIHGFLFGTIPFGIYYITRFLSNK